MVDFYPIFKDWENQLDDNYVSQWPDSPYPKHPKFLDPQYVPELEKVYVPLLVMAMKSLTPSKARSHKTIYPHQGYRGMGHCRYVPY